VKGTLTSTSTKSIFVRLFVRSHFSEHVKRILN